ncbi:PREDICTED: uncharacterized protein LOC108364776 [Rhagoletis zephyria]|uniref:uncharacterized protein LOC108364776 n=1 Tax=Rhagoletis zephyria TaxID=28612 RepID=UPI000811603F|nr:PREDICTED: uncharacterized protein LOC108364776 [Rhagoletis zephyria]
MILVFHDKFSKLLEIVPLRRVTTEGLSKSFRERILARFGVPKVLVTDNGPQFTSRAFKRFLEQYGVKHQFTAPYTPQENPTEGTNRIITQLTDEQQRNWDGLLPEIMLVLNTSVCESTGYIPAFLTQGREPRLPRAVYDETTFGTGQNSTTPNEKATSLKEVFSLVRQNQQRASAEQARHYNLRRRQWRPAIEDLVLLREHLQSKAVTNFAAKLAPNYSGGGKTRKDEDSPHKRNKGFYERRDELPGSSKQTTPRENTKNRNKDTEAKKEI